MNYQELIDGYMIEQDSDVVVKEFVTDDDYVIVFKVNQMIRSEDYKDLYLEQDTTVTLIVGSIIQKEDGTWEVWFDDSNSYLPISLESEVPMYEVVFVYKMV